MLSGYQRADLRCRAELFERIAAETLADVKQADARLKDAARKSPALAAIRAEVVEAANFFDRMAEFVRLAVALQKANRAAAEGRDADVEAALQAQLAAEPVSVRAFRKPPCGRKDDEERRSEVRESNFGLR